MKALRFFDPLLTRTVAMLLIAGILLAVYGIARAHARLEADQLRRALCAEKLRGLVTRNMFAERYVRPADPCRAWALVEGSR